MRGFAYSGTLFTLCLALQAGAQTACVEPTGSEFRTVTLVASGGALTETTNSSAGPVGMSVVPDGRVFVIQMQSGDVQMYDPTTQKVSTVGNIPVRFDTEDGLLGVATPPDFETTHWIYFDYTLPGNSTRTVELSRWTVTNNQLTNKKVILQFQRDPNDNHHAAGGMSFDSLGNLVFGAGDNSDPHDSYNAGYAPINPNLSSANAQRSAGNTNDLRGKVLRIHPLPFADGQTPTPGIGNTYSIPTGNLWEKINDPTFNPNWKSATDSISLVRHEIYAMGDRNPYHPRVDTRSGWIFWGEVGPDANADSPTRGPSGHDEWNLAMTPGFYGHPYCNGYNVPWGIPPFSGALYNCQVPVNNSPVNTGIHDLPPSVPALVAYTSGNSTDDDPRFNASGISTTTINHGAETAIGGQMYRYDPNLSSTVKFPPYYEGKVLFFDWSRQTLLWIVLDSTGHIPAGTAGVRAFAPQGFPKASYIDAQFGPEGALYMLRFSDCGYCTGSGALYRIEYTGSYDDACYKPFGPVAPTALAARPHQQALSPMAANGVYTLPTGYRSLELFDLSGRKVWSFHRSQIDDPLAVKLPAFLAKGIWEARIAP